MLQNRASEVILRALFDISLATLSCLCLSLDIIAPGLNGQSFSTYGEKVMEAARLGPSIFPTAFATIIARFYKHMARWQEERDRSLGVRLVTSVWQAHTDFYR